MSGNLTLVVCGAPLAARSVEVAELVAAAGWNVTVVRSAAATQWLPDVPEPAERRRPEQVVALPLTFNTANKVVGGIMDTPACGALCDALGAGVPTTAVVMVNDRLWGHPVWPGTLATLAAAGVRFLDPHSGRPGSPAPVRSGSGPDVVAGFDPRWVVAALPS